MELGLVSVIMPAYNCEKYIGEAINSVIAQKYSNWELLVVNDCSADNTKEVVEAYLKDNRIHYFELPSRGGPATARNRGLEEAKGEYVAFLDSDDLWSADKLELQLDYMKRMKAKLSCTAYSLIDEEGNERNIINVPPKKTGYWKMFLMGDPVGNSTTMFDRKAFENVRVPEIKKRNDFALWLDLTRGGDAFYGMKQPLAKYRVRRNSVSSNKKSLIKYQWELYRRIEGHSLAMSVFAFATLIAVKGLKKIRNLLYGWVK